MKAKVFSPKTKYSKLLLVKNIKEITGLFLKESKFLADDLETQDFITIDVNKNIDKQYAINLFNDNNVLITFIDREEKLKRLLYSNQETLIEDMLMEKWENFVDTETLETFPYKQCKEIAVKNIIKKYKEFIGVEMFYEIINDINRINELESKDIGFKFMKLNEEFGEFNAEYIKFKGYTYKEYDKEELKAEMADTLQVLLSIYGTISKETGIEISDILEKIIEKNKKWKEKII